MKLKGLLVSLTVCTKLFFNYLKFSAAKDKNFIIEAIDRIQAKTCIKFEPRGSQKDYISIQNSDTGCYSSIGKTGGKQVVNLQSPGCFKTKAGTAIHELLHVLGLYHEQNWSDRDEHVRINYENMFKEYEENFEKMPATKISSFGTKYNVASILHYSPYAFSKNSKKTIEVLRNSPMNSKMGQRDDLTDDDVKKVNAMYCQKKSV